VTPGRPRCHVLTVLTKTAVAEDGLDAQVTVKAHELLALLQVLGFQGQHDANLRMEKTESALESQRWTDTIPPKGRRVVCDIDGCGAMLCWTSSGHICSDASKDHGGGGPTRAIDLP
jgi:hypothetical protein